MAQQDAVYGREEFAGASGTVEADARAADYVYTDEIDADGLSGEIDPEEMAPEPWSPGARRRLLIGIGVLVAVGLLAVLPPLINVNRYSKRIAASISVSLGRPVHLDSVSLNVLPWPGFTLTDFVVSEDPAFGSEPVIRADSVRATLRLRSLWNRRVEFSRIALDAPSVNLVRRESDGRWNIESILLQASRMPASPTEQKAAPGVPRFPYIEATGARVNFKEGLVKKPLSLTDAEFSLWLPEPQMWRVRLEAHPTRTDTPTMETGTFTLDGTLGKAETLDAVPVDLRAAWTAVPLGAASWVVMGHDGDVRGEMSLRASVKGTVGDNVATARLVADQVRRAEWVPARTLSVDVSCKARAREDFHRLTEAKCLWPPGAEQNGVGAASATGELGNIHRFETADMEVKWNGVQIADLMDVLRAASERMSPELEAGGLASGTWNCCGAGPGWGSSGDFILSHVRVKLGAAVLHGEDDEIAGTLAGDSATVEPFELDLGGPQPALLSVSADQVGMRMRLVGPVLRSRLLALGKALPQFGEGLEAVLPVETPTKGVEALAKSIEIPVKVELVAVRGWSGSTVWSSNVVGRPKIRQPLRRERGDRY